PMPMPSVTVGNPNTCGIALASLRASITRSTRGWMPALQGFIVEWPLATPTIGFSKSSSLKPTARNMARLGERATPAVISWERLLSFVTTVSFPACRSIPRHGRHPSNAWRFYLHIHTEAIRTGLDGHFRPALRNLDFLDGHPTARHHVIQHGRT